MENSEVENICIEDGPLSRSRSFKTKQLVRSQAIRESQSPPHTSPAHAANVRSGRRAPCASGDASDASSPASDLGRDDDRKKHVEIQISGGGWECEQLEQRQRAQLWPGRAPDLLSYNPRVACVCGACGACPHCKGRRRKPVCPKQDSGIVCSDECPDCSDSEQTGSPKEVPKKSVSLEADDTYYCRCPERKERPRTILLNRTDSDDKLEPTGPELVDFIKETLNKNSRDRLTLLKIEKELHNLVNDTGRCIVRFPVMTSYGRMLVHRCAALFQLSHHIDQNNKTCVMVSKTGTSGGRIPCTSFKEWCTTVFPASPQHRRDDTLAKSILKRSSAAGEEAGGAAGGAARSKSLEQREREYERVRRRIFSSDNCTQDETQWPWLATGPVKLLTSEGRNKLIKVQSLESRGGELPRAARGPVSKSHSFGGYAAEPPNTRLLSKQGDLASSSWRLSPSSSGYKTLSLRSTDSVTPSPTGGASPEPGSMGAMGALGMECTEGGTLVWAVTDLSAVPPGALVIHPQTGRPLTNPDGSLYHFDPANPPVLHDANVFLPNDQFKVDPNNEKRRGRLEKQHSFMDNECECQSGEDCRTKCCCECRRQAGQDSSGNNTNEASTQEEKPNSIPPSPSKSRQEETIDDDNAQIDNNQYEQNDIINTQPTTTYEHQKEFEQSTIQHENQKEFQQSTNQCEPKEIQQPTNPYDQREFQQSTNQYEQKEYQAPANQYNQREFQQPTNPYEQKEYLPPTNHYEQKEYQQPTTQYEQKEFRPRSYEAQKIYDPNENSRMFDNQRPYDIPQKPYEQYGSPSHRTPSLEQQKAFENAQRNEAIAQRMANKMSQDGQDMVQYFHHQNYMQGYRNDEVTSPAQVQAQALGTTYLQQDMSNVHMMQHKLTPLPVPLPLPLPEHNIRPMSMSNVVYPSPMPQGYPYVNQCRMEAPLQQVYPQLMPSLEEPKHSNDNTFRIDPSYPYAADFSAACGACASAGACDPAMQHQPRGYNVPYGQVEMQQYPVGNVLVPQQMPHYPISYGEAVPWGVQPTQPKLLVQEVYPLVYPNVYPQYNVVYPPVLQQPYPICQPMYPVIDKPSEPPRRNSAASNRLSKQTSIAGSARNTPDDKPKDFDDKNQPSIQNQQNREPVRNLSRQNSNEIAVKIQQIKEQMSQLNTRDDRSFRKDEWKRRNSGSGILGNYPVANFNGRVMGRDDNQLSTAARAIVNSIRSMQARNNYHQDGRRTFDYSPQYRTERQEGAQRGRRHDRDDKDKPAFKKAESFDAKPEGERRFDGIPRNRNFNPLPFQYRPPYLFRQMSPGAWCRRSPGPVHPVLGHPRRPHPDTRNGRR
ncbi:PREDICTED: uncharacterized protein LOC106124473 [Papilio xuthus]|uniref:Uncharacterized protein LOC106124473 n=1 Tax=Papilio xuthus TaxID=66420 RepID=A0AAJ6ZP42_PAPXU|nr:PREDICTED: uncharacterized protein LOC106124473 [Papilio xuthus]